MLNIKSIYCYTCRKASDELTLSAIMQGWRVFSGVRSEADADRLRQLHADINPVVIDVTS